jgi:hypothetical protein
MCGSREHGSFLDWCQGSGLLRRYSSELRKWRWLLAQGLDSSDGWVCLVFQILGGMVSTVQEMIGKWGRGAACCFVTCLITVYLCIKKDSSSFFFFLALFGFELRALHSLGRCSTTWATSPALSAFRYFLNKVFLAFLPRLAWTLILLFLLPT